MHALYGRRQGFGARSDRSIGESPIGDRPVVATHCPRGDRARWHGRCLRRAPTKPHVRRPPAPSVGRGAPAVDLTIGSHLRRTSWVRWAIYRSARRRKCAQAHGSRVVLTDRTLIRHARQRSGESRSIDRARREAPPSAYDRWRTMADVFTQGAAMTTTTTTAATAAEARLRERCRSSSSSDRRRSFPGSCCASPGP